jgi:hypothetical protein
VAKPAPIKKYDEVLKIMRASKSKEAHYIVAYIEAMDDKTPASVMEAADEMLGWVLALHQAAGIEAGHGV